MKSNFKFLMLNDELKNSKFPHRGFSMVELIFVIILIGILAYVGSGFLPDNRLLEYTDRAIINLKKTQNRALGYDADGFGSPWSDSNITCINLDKKHLVDINSSLVGVSSNINRVCFDTHGRPYSPSEHKLLGDFNITIHYDSDTEIISVYSYSGYVTLIE